MDTLVPWLASDAAACAPHVADQMSRPCCTCSSTPVPSNKPNAHLPRAAIQEDLCAAGSVPLSVARRLQRLKDGLQAGAVRAVRV